MKGIFTKTSVLIAFCCLLFITSVSAQTTTIKGVVTDGLARMSLPGASVIIKGTTTGTQTDVNGKYTINAPANAILVFTSIGYDKQEVSVNGQTEINVTLTSSTQQLNQVVVVGYGTQRKRDLTGAITSVKGEDIAKFTVTNPIAALQGSVAGLSVVNSGTPGAAPIVRIRGIASTNNADPLYVVDGLLQTNIDFLNPNDIETIDLLKDASSTAIYGLKGANGVIAITTKRAAKGKTSVNFQSNFGIQHVNNKIDVVDAAGFKKLYSAQLANLNAAPFDFTNYIANTDWQSLILRNAVINTDNLTVSNNNDKSTTIFNLGYSDQQGVVRYGDYKKYLVRLSEEIKINNNIKVGGSINGFKWQQDPTAVGLNAGIYAAPIAPVQAPGDDIYYTMPSFQRAQVGNPINAINRSRGNSINGGYRINGNVFAEIKFLKDFTFRSTFYTDLGFNNARSYNPLPFTVVNLGEGSNPTTTFTDKTVKTSVSQSANEYRSFQQDHILTYDKDLKGGHRLNIIAGFTTVQLSSTLLSGSRTDTTLNVPFNSNLWYLNIINANNPISNSGGGSLESQTGIFGRASYAYKSKYLVNATIRRDGSSRFAPQNRWGTFGSIGLGWVASEEDFFRNLAPGIDFLKFRAAFGKLGNQNAVQPNLYQQTLNSGITAVFGDNVYPAVTAAYRPDSNLHWEVVRGIDLGVELRTLHNRLNLEVGVYNKTTDGLLTTFTLPGAAGTQQAYFTNLGKLTNKGIEVNLGWNDRIGKDFSYRVNTNFSYNKNIVNSVGNTTAFQLLGNGGINVTETGNSVGYFYGYRQVGVYQSTADLTNQPHFANSLPGDIAYADINGDGVITTADRTYLGTPFPPYNYGLSVSLAYKNLDVLLAGQGVAGNKIWLQRRTANFAVLNYESNRLNAWTAPGTSNVEPILDNSRGNNYLFSSYYLEPGDYFRLRNIQVGYNLPTALNGKIGVQNIRIFVSGENIKTWTKATGYSPEPQIGSLLSGGADNGTYPVPAIYTVGLNVTF
ncbi:SusC/RagA family TonB-linked outer membrane protein [Mucilaginibacter boryungensis]|uniref:TonB-dependent receptor n=1 Tax=Mucilaginibacter boryungensis TaxID=768480 RepID=A0ABR9XE97_9SPHI|nr:TonB-dependent receptor [Mucilaginibacter boryungensis]MBE9665714.1 TonB-dependent receptor [Mucilaginibacter boryungensis]